MYKLLIVDDEIRQLKALANLFEQLRPDYDIITASNGMEALNLIRNNDIDILFTDIKMSKMDGIELIKEVNKNK
jgi:two-component system response regulator YesN